MLAIWDLGRVSFQSKLRDTVLASMGCRGGAMEVGRKKAKGHGACDLVFGKRFCSKYPNDTVLAIWALGRGSFQNSRGTALAIECLGKLFKKNEGARRLRFGFPKQTKGHGACDYGGVGVERWRWVEKNKGPLCLRFGIWEKIFVPKT